MRATKHNLFSARLSTYSQPNRPYYISSAYLNLACMSHTSQAEDVRATKHTPSRIARLPRLEPWSPRWQDGSWLVDWTPAACHRPPTCPLTGAAQTSLACLPATQLV